MSVNISAKGRTYALIGGVIALLAEVVLRFVIGGPWTVFLHLDARGLLPPLWLLGIFWYGIPILIGVAAGVLLGSIHHAAEAEAAFWRGCTLLVLSVTCLFAWYALLFGKFSLFFSGIALLAAAFLAALGGLSWKHLSAAAGMIAWGNALWCLILFFLQLAVVLHV